MLLERREIGSLADDAAAVADLIGATVFVFSPRNRL